MNSTYSPLRKLAAKGLIPLSLMVAIATGSPSVSAQQTPLQGEYSTQDKKEQHAKPSFGEKLYQPSFLDGEHGIWIGRSLTPISRGEMTVPQLDEYFLSDDNILYKTSLVSGDTKASKESTSVLPLKVADSLRDKNPSIPPKLVFDHFFNV